jgi:hypothetical protein
VAKPTKHGAKWRIRWLDEHGKRQSAVFDDYKRAQTELSRQQVEVEQICSQIINRGLLAFGLRGALFAIKARRWAFFAAPSR